VAYCIYFERKIAAWIQDRYGPNRVGPLGLLQPVADGLKFIFKEEIIPRRVDKFLYILAPTISLSTALLAFAVVPFGATTPPPLPSDPQYAQKLAEYRASYQFVIAPGLDIGIVWVFAVSSLTVYGVILGGYAGNNKYSFLGGLRSSAQLVSYEIPLGLSILGVVLMSGSLNLEWIIHHQAAPTGGGWGMWNVVYQPLAFLIFLLSSFAECNRLPFDLAEAEQELVGGYHTEYSAWKFAMFFMGEYTHMITTSFLMVILFFGGWHLPFLVGADAGWFAKLVVFGVKMAVFIFFYMLVRWTLPRFRFDQLMGLAWKVLIPLALANLVGVMVVMEFSLSPWLLLPLSVVLLIASGWINTAEPRAPIRRVPVPGPAHVEALTR
jgi:NADH-quinone oxidoreductase subunit H